MKTDGIVALTAMDTGLHACDTTKLNIVSLISTLYLAVHVEYKTLTIRMIIKIKSEILLSDTKAMACAVY